MQIQPGQRPLNADSTYKRHKSSGVWVSTFLEMWTPLSLSLSFPAKKHLNKYSRHKTKSNAKPAWTLFISCNWTKVVVFLLFLCLIGSNTNEKFTRIALKWQRYWLHGQFKIQKVSRDVAHLRSLPKYHSHFNYIIPNQTDNSRPFANFLSNFVRAFSTERL